MTTDISRHSEPTKWVKNLFRQYLVNSANKQIPKRVRNDKQFPVTLNCLGFPSQKQVVRFTTLALTFVFATSGLRYRFALRQSARFRVFVANEFSEKLIISFAILSIIG